MSIGTATIEYEFICPLPNGLHARPANCLEQVVVGFVSDISVVNLNNNKKANVKSVLSLIGADIKKGDKCLVVVQGNDAKPAYDALVDFIEHKLPDCDAALPEMVYETNKVILPPVLEDAGIDVIPGNPVVSGIGRGKAVFFEKLKLPESLNIAGFVDVNDELSEVERAISELSSDITDNLSSGRATVVEREILNTHLSIANDVELLNKVRYLINNEGISAGEAMLSAVEHFSKILKMAESGLIRERVLDLRDVCYQVLKNIYHGKIDDSVKLDSHSICIAGNLTPCQFMSLDKEKLKGMVLTHAGNTSHTVILARSFGIPTLTGVDGVCLNIENGKEVIVDADLGIIVTEINEKVERYYALENRKQKAIAQKCTIFKKKPATTKDGSSIKVMANVATADEVEIAIANGAQGIGLFRTEMLFMDRQEAPSEDEQFEEYRKAAANANGSRVVIRTFDIGGDKSVGYLNLPKEGNPFLGYRAVRLYNEYEKLFKDQLRAILRASAYGNLELMIPMISCIEEVLWVKEKVKQVKEALDSESISYNTDIKLGIMIEVPAAAFIIPHLSKEVDFFSIGTNDLAQYFFAADRCNEKVKSLYNSNHPALLSLIKKIVDDADVNGIRVGMCGEMAGKVENLPILLGLGLKEISLASPSIAGIKAECAGLDRASCKELVIKILNCASSDQVEVVIAEQCRMNSHAVVEVGLIDLQVDCIDRAEVIKYISDILYINGRTNSPLEMEKEFWKRESVYSTGLGYGFAIPHCKNGLVNCHSICVFRLDKPIKWDSSDKKPVGMIIAMAIKDGETAGDSHMQIFSRLAKKIMCREFRNKLRILLSEHEVVRFLYDQLALKDIQ